MGHATEEIEAPALPPDRLGHQLGGHVSGIEAVPRVSLGIEHIGVLLEAPDLRQPVGAYAYHAPPLKLDGGARQLREDPQQLGQHKRLDVLGIAPRVVAGPAKQQATIGR
ncbi:hypothetical protein D3C75_464370 [compost metagenome]